MKRNRNQAAHILAVLRMAGLDFIVQHTPIGVRVETEGRGGQDGLECTGRDVVDALGQLTTVLALDLELEAEEVEGASWTHDAPLDADAPAPYTLEEPVEFCTAYVLDCEGLAPERIRAIVGAL